VKLNNEDYLPDIPEKNFLSQVDISNVSEVEHKDPYQSRIQFTTADKTLLKILIFRLAYHQAAP
jgi:hypothetical protein